MTDRGIPLEMKTGFNLVEDNSVTENIASIIIAFMENAVKSAAIYVKHAHRNSISVEDIKRALMLEVFFMKQRPNMLEQCEKIKKMIKEIHNKDDSDSDEEIIYDDEEDEFKESECTCPMCGCMNTTYTRWEGFVPETSIEKALHKHIENFA